MQALSKIKNSVRKLRGYREADETEKVAILQAFANIVEKVNDESTKTYIEKFRNAEKIEIHSEMIDPPKKFLGGFGNCFDPDFDFRYDDNTRTLKLGGNFESLYLLGEVISKGKR